MTSKQRFYYLILLGIVILSAGLRLSALNRTVRWDEIRNLQDYAVNPPAEFLFNFSDTNNHFVNTLLMHIQYRLLGNDEDWKIRVHVFIAGLLVVVGTYYLGKELYSAEVGLIGSALTSVMYLLVEFSINARGYIFIVLIYIVMVILIHRARQSTDIRLWGVIGLLAAVGFLVSPIFLYTMGTLGLWAVMMIFVDNKGRQRRNVFIYFVGAMILGGIITGAYYGFAIYSTFIKDSSESGYEGSRIASYTDPIDVDNYVTNLIGGTGVKLFQETHRGMLGWTVGLMLIGAVLGIILHPWVAIHRIPILIPTVIWLIFQIGIQRTFVLERTFIFLMPIYALLIGAGWLFVFRKVTGNRISPVLTGILISAILVIPTLVTTINDQRLYNTWITGAMPFGKEVVEYFKTNPDEMDTPIYLSRAPYFIMSYYRELTQFDADLRLINPRQQGFVDVIKADQPLFIIEPNGLSVERLESDYYADFSDERIVLNPMKQITEHYTLYEIYSGRPKLTPVVQNMEIAENIWYRGANSAIEFVLDDNNQLSFKIGDADWNYLSNRLGTYWQDYRLTLDMRIVESSPAFEDFMIRFRDKDNSRLGLVFEVEELVDEPNVAFRMDVDGRVLNYFSQTYYPLVLGEWVHVMIDLDGSVFTAYVDDVEIGQFEASLLTEGTLTFLTAPGAQVEIRAITIE